MAESLSTTEVVEEIAKHRERAVGAREGRDRLISIAEPFCHFPVRSARYGLIGLAGALFIVSLVELPGLPAPPS